MAARGCWVLVWGRMVWRWTCLSCSKKGSGLRSRCPTASCCCCACRCSPGKCSRNTRKVSNSSNSSNNSDSRLQQTSLAAGLRHRKRRAVRVNLARGNARLHLLLQRRGPLGLLVSLQQAVQQQHQDVLCSQLRTEAT